MYQNQSRQLCSSPLTPAVSCPTCGQVLNTWSVYDGSEDEAVAPTLPFPVYTGRRGEAPGAWDSGRLAPRSRRCRHPLVFLLSIFLVLVLLLLGFGFLAVLAQHRTTSTIPQAQTQATPIPTRQATPIPPPAPTLALSSQYHVGALSAGVTGTTLQVVGDHFTANTGVIFLLDGLDAPGALRVQNDSSGQVQADLLVTADWAIGNHVLAAQEAGSHHASNSVAVVVVAQGEAMTPGPNGAPYDSESYALTVTVSPTGAPSYTRSLTVPDPADGLVCAPQRDTNQSVSLTGKTSSGTNYVLTSIATCSGPYKGGS